MVEHGRDVVASRFDPTYVLLDKCAELRTRELRVRNRVVGLLLTADAKSNPWRDQLFVVLRELDGGAGSVTLGG